MSSVKLRPRKTTEGAHTMKTTSPSDSSVSFGNVMLIYTGGTIGMVPNNDGEYYNVPGKLFNYLYSNPLFNDFTYPAPTTSKRKLPNKRVTDDTGILYDPMYMPIITKDTTEENPIYLKYTMYEYTNLLDSSNMTIDVMMQIADTISTNYSAYDAFVILHGTDTMAYSASGLSFSLENLKKVVIITGSQIPIYETRTDARDNLTGSLLMAGQYSDIPEVCLFFDSQLLRGNRTTKISAETLEAYASPNFPVLGEVEVNISVDKSLILKPSPDPFTSYVDISPNIAVVRFYPDMSLALLTAALASPVKGVVLQCYGAGNFPSNNQDLLDAIEDAVNSGIVVVDNTQCLKGGVVFSYAAGAALERIGVIAGGDMTTEASLMKLSYLIAKYPGSPDDIKQQMAVDLRGELTVAPLGSTVVTKTLSAVGIESSVTKTAQSIVDLKEAVYLPILQLAIKKRDKCAIKEILKMEPGVLKLKDSEGKTALHFAVIEGKTDIIQDLIKEGASVQTRDRLGRSPLLEAVQSKKMENVLLLFRHGAHLTMDSMELGVELNKAAARNDVDLLKAFAAAGASMTAVDYSSKTPLETARQCKSNKCIQYLRRHRGGPSTKKARKPRR